MRAGKLDRRITIEREVETVDEFGTVARAWTPITTVPIPAQLIQSGTDEFLQVFGESTKAAAVFRIRWRPGVLMTDRVTHNGTAYDLIELKEIGRRVGLELRCEASQ